MKELFTRSYDKNWGRIVELYIEKGTSVSQYINDHSTCKVVIIEKGELVLEAVGAQYEIIAPSFFVLNNSEEVTVIKEKSLKITTLFLDPVVVREEFTYDRINSFEFENLTGQSIYQDYVLVRTFRENIPFEKKFFQIPFTAFQKINGIINKMENELVGQLDGFWPCRSRSLLLELLYFLTYTYIYHEDTIEEDSILCSEITDYLHEHINEQLSLNDITKAFSINRNKLNEVFVSQTAMTCMAYLLQMRIDLSKILLTKTQIPVGEISARVGYEDPNYFSKIFKQQTGSSPLKYRQSNS